MDTGHAGRPDPTRLQRPAPGARAILDPPTAAQPRRLSLRRAVANARHPWAAPDRPVAPGLSPSHPAPFHDRGSARCEARCVAWDDIATQRWLRLMAKVLGYLRRTNAQAVAPEPDG